ncbi:uncharacterized protein ARMOST_20038 [Armillaria ostoyae]|uniref:Uncharacterized protein n=1 Tax=Armillaria ostoyae TaxID=47428 RepID=A0A284S676_ARMOS|nr:uncharacterized protein ARMOST_20038 [Armillaria ostoyae]
MADPQLYSSISPIVHSPMSSSNTELTNWTASQDTGNRHSPPYFSRTSSDYQTPLPRPYSTGASFSYAALYSEQALPSPSPHPSSISWSPSSPTSPDHATMCPNGSINSSASSVPTTVNLVNTSTSSVSPTIKPVVIDRLAKDFELAKPQCKHLHLFTENVLLKEKDNIGFKNVFGVPSREHLLHSEIHVISSSVRNRMREDIHDSLKKTLVEFTVDMNKNVFHRFVAENQNLVWALEDPCLEEENQPPHSTQPPKKKRKLPTGRSAKGEDFWSQMDEYFKGKIEQYQSDSLLFIDQMLAYDKSGFKFLPITPAFSPAESGDEAPSTVSTGSGAKDLMALLN